MSSSRALAPLLVAALAVLCACGGDDTTPPDAGARDATVPRPDAAACLDGERDCVGALHVRCEAGEMIVDDCAAAGTWCDPGLGCVPCEPDTITCSGPHVARCGADGSWTIQTCDLGAGLGCRAEGSSGAACQDLCAAAEASPSGRGCEFFAVQLDNAEVGLVDLRPFGVIVSNPWPVAVEVVVEVDDGPIGGASEPREIRRLLVPPQDDEAIELPHRPVDRPALGAAPTHTAVTRHGFRITTAMPVVVHQHNPLDGRDVAGSADSSRLLPVSATGTDYTINAWPQTIADSDDPEYDSDPTRDDEDLRASLTIVGTAADTHVTIALGGLGFHDPAVVAGGPIPELGPRAIHEIDIGAFEVVNLETRGLNTDFTGTLVQADAPVAIFVGSEASDAPLFEYYRMRQCCADHLEEQLLPDMHGGQRFVVGRGASRSAALARALDDGSASGVYDEPEWVRVVALSDQAQIQTTLPEVPSANLSRGENLLIRVDRSFALQAVNTDGRVSVNSVMAGQQGIGVPGNLPAGDPSLVAWPSLDQLVSDHVFSVPAGYPFDLLTVVAERGTMVLLDGTPLPMLRGPDGAPACSAESFAESGAPGATEWIAYRCQLSFPDVLGPDSLVIDPGAQADGFHHLTASAPVAVVVWGFSAYASYAFPGELDLSEGGP